MMMNNLVNSQKSQINLPAQLNSTQVRCKEALFVDRAVLILPQIPAAVKRSSYIPT